MGILPPPRERGHSHDVHNPCVASECTGHPDWKLIRDAGEVKPATRATIAMEKIARLLPWSDVAVGWHSPATPEQIADALERVQAELAKLITRATEAEAERDHYREVIAGGRAWLGLVMPELVYPARILQGLPDGDDAPEWPMHVGTLHVLPPDPLTELQTSVNAMLEKLDTMMPTWRDGAQPANPDEPEYRQPGYRRGWCTRCGHPYEWDADKRMLTPTCEDAGDPPVDRSSEDYAEWVRKVGNLFREPTD